jgi:hypothetical protein
MAQLQDGSECAEGIFVNTTNNYTMVKLPAGAAGDVGFIKMDSYFMTQLLGKYLFMIILLPYIISLKLTLPLFNYVKILYYS